YSNNERIDSTQFHVDVSIS
ncbi:TPA: exotoxin beta-grasp domain-containing protein, partial [Streptococcus pyogenes]